MEVQRDVKMASVLPNIGMPNSPLVGTSLGGGRGTGLGSGMAAGSGQAMEAILVAAQGGLVVE